MGLGEYWKDVREFQQDKRRSNYEYNKKALQDNKVHFAEKANGHFIISDAAGKPLFDFWASTGLFISRDNQKKNRGIRNLLRTLKEMGK